MIVSVKTILKWVKCLSTKRPSLNRFIKSITHGAKQYLSPNSAKFIIKVGLLLSTCIIA